ncbi:MAG: response regulator transcription factor [Bacteroidia bacterium]|nr:response regulator transcription factor [Bacteroidia bacterium]
MNCIVIDDEEISRKSLEMCINRTDFLNLTGSFSSVADAISFISANKTDIIFLDIEMPGINGIDFLKNFKNSSQVVVVSGNKDYAADAFDFNVTDYIVKPVEYARFLKAAMRASEIKSSLQVSATENDDLFIKKDNRLIKLNAKDIVWIEALADYVNIHCINNERHTLLATMKLMEDKLKKTDFARIHRSYIIRLDKIKEIEENSVSVNGKVLPISRGYKDNLYNKLNLI